MDYFSLHGFVCLMIFCFVIVCVQGDPTGDCQRINSCSCSYSGGVTVDLSPLTGNPTFQDYPDPTLPGTSYSYNLCAPYTEGTCTDMAVCQVNDGIDYPCGSQDSAVFIKSDSGALQLQYSYTDGTATTRTSTVTLTCIQSGDDQLIVNGEGTSTYYGFELKSVHCCPKGGGPTPEPHPGKPGHSGNGGLSIGSIITIAFFALVLVYFIGGTLFLKYGRKANGVEMIPNRGFWATLPGLTKDGVMFVVRRGKTSGYNRV